MPQHKSTLSRFDNRGDSLLKMSINDVVRYTASLLSIHSYWKKPSNAHSTTRTTKRLSG